MRDRERDRPGARADVDDARRRDALEQRETALDDQLCLGPRHECARVGLEREVSKVPVAEHVGERLAPPASRDELARRRALASVSGRSCCV